MRQILLNTIRLENNNLMTFTEKTMMPTNHVVENTMPSITEMFISQLLTKLIHTKQTNNPYRNFSPSILMYIPSM